MARNRSYLDINSDDDHATRVLALAIKFFGATRPIPSSVINEEIYPSLDPSSFRRQFLRDRNILLSLGVTLNEVETKDNVSYWQIDQDTSFVEETSLGAEDASMQKASPATAAIIDFFMFIFRVAFRFFRWAASHRTKKLNPTIQNLAALIDEKLSEHYTKKRRRMPWKVCHVAMEASVI